jgi:hypothetical protein
VLELIVAILLIVLMVKIANNDGQTGWVWGVITFFVTLVCMVLIPLPLLRVGVAGIAVFVGMIGYKTVANR